MTNELGNRTTEWRLPRLLTTSTIEKWVATLSPTTKKVIVKLGSWRRTGPFADARLQSALCFLHRKDVETIAIVPPNTLKGNRADAAFANPADRDPLQPPDPLTPTERKLAGSVAGMVIGQLCSFDEEHDDIPELQRKNLTQRRHLFGWGAERALVVPTETTPTGLPRQTARVREAAFNNRLEELLEPLGVNMNNARQDTVQWFNALKMFAFEASENTWDHGRLDFDTRPIRSVRFVRLRRIDLGRKGLDIDKVAPGFEETFRHYLESLAAAQDLSTRWDPGGGRLIEVTVADGGVGISARMAGGFDVFEKSLDDEKRYLRDALLPNRTTKSASETGRGQGIGKMLHACFRLSGLTIVRTGRLEAWRTYRQPDGSKEDVDFKDASSDTYTLNFSNTALPLTAGTSVSLIFPIVRLRRVQRPKDF